jgi:hypothetical protein
LAQAIKVLGVSAEIINEPDTLTRIAKLLEHLKDATPAFKSAIFKQLASELAKVTSGQTEIRGHSIDLLTQLVYSKMKENVEHDSLPTNKEIEEAQRLEPQNDPQLEDNSNEVVSD